MMKNSGGPGHSNRSIKPFGRFRVRTGAVAVLTMSALAGLDAAAGPHLILAGMIAVGPCLTAVSGNARAVLAVGGYAVALISVLAWGPDQIFATRHHLLYVLATITVTAVSFVLARRVQRLERFAAQAHAPLQTLAALVAGSDDAIIGKTLDGTVTSWNAAAERMYGYAAAEVIGANISIMAGPAGPSEFGEVLDRIAAGEPVDHFETRRTRKDGSVVDVSVTVSPIRDDHGIVVGASAVARDISARKRAEARQREIDERTALAQRLQSLGQLAGGVAHDFNNLLVIISNFTAFVIDQTAGDKAVQADLAQVSAAAERAAALTRQLLLFTRGETARPEILDANAALAEAHALLARTIGEDIELIVVPSAEPLLIRADSGRIQQVLINLAVNARDAMPDGGTLVIEATLADLDENQTGLQPGLLDAGRYVRLLVSDTGTGMSKDVAARIFEPFFTTKPTGKGTGLGLATVYGIVTDAGGSLNVYSEPHLGTTFRAYFPVADKPGRQPVTPPELVELPRGDGQRILVVDDEEPIREVLRRILDDAGYQILIAGSGAEALGLDTPSGCDLLLTDVVMPGMSGRRLAELLRRRHPGLPVLYMSGYSDGLRATVPADGQDIGFVEKPFTAMGVLRRIHDLLTPGQVSTPAGVRS